MIDANLCIQLENSLPHSRSPKVITQPVSKPAVGRPMSRHSGVKLEYNPAVVRRRGAGRSPDEYSRLCNPNELYHRLLLQVQTALVLLLLIGAETAFFEHISLYKSRGALRKLFSWREQRPVNRSIIFVS